MRQTRLLVVAILACVLVPLVSACGGKTGDNPIGPTPTPTPTPQYDPNVPTPGLDNNERRLVDGAGNPGPVRIRLISVNPAPGSAVVLVEAFHALFVSFKAEVCMDAVPNPTSSRYLSEMRITVFGSADGVSPMGPNLAQGEGPGIYHVSNGGCTIVKRIPVDQGGTPGNQFIYFGLGAKHLMFTATYGMGTSQEMTFNWPAEACPSFEVIARGPWPFPPGTPNCVLRSGYFLDYRW